MESSKHYVVDGLLTEGNVGASSNALDAGTNVSFGEAPDSPAILMFKDIIPDSLHQVAIQMAGCCCWKTPEVPALDANVDIHRLLKKMKLSDKTLPSNKTKK